MADDGKTAPVKRPLPVASETALPVTRNSDGARVSSESQMHWFSTSTYCPVNPGESARDHGAHALQITFLTSFGNAGTVDFVDEASSQLHSPDACVRGAAVWALGEIGPQALTRIDVPADGLLSSLRLLVAKDPDTRVREEARTTLTKIQPE